MTAHIVSYGGYDISVVIGIAQSPCGVFDFAMVEIVFRFNGKMAKHVDRLRWNLAECRLNAQTLAGGV